MINRHITLAVSLAFSVVAAETAHPAAYAFSQAPSASQGQLTLGFTFTANQTFVVTSLGYYDDLGNGFISDHEVGIYSGDGAQGPGQLLVSTDLAMGKSGVLGANDFRYQTIAPLTLVAGQSYTIAGVSPFYSKLNDAFVYGGPSEIKNFSVSPLITIGPDAARYAYDTPTLADPSLHFGHYEIYAVDFAGPKLFAAGVPEPASWTLMLFGVFGLGALARRGRKRDFPGGGANGVQQAAC